MVPLDIAGEKTQFDRSNPTAFNARPTERQAGGGLGGPNLMQKGWWNGEDSPWGLGRSMGLDLWAKQQSTRSALLNRLALQSILMHLKLLFHKSGLN